MQNIIGFLFFSMSASLHFMIYFNEDNKTALVVGIIMTFFSVLNIVSLIS